MTIAASYREFIEQVRAANPIADVVNRYVKLNKSLRAPCPFHRETIPSFGVTPPDWANPHFYCFGCKAGGDAFKFVQLMAGVTFGQAVELMAGWAGLPVYQPRAQDREALEQEQAALYVTEAVARYYRSVLTQEAADYFVRHRRLPEEFLERFMIGWADGQACAYVEKALGPAWLVAMESAGLATVVRNQMSWTGAEVYRDLLFERLILPMFVHKQPAFLSGRALDDRDPKYQHQRGREVPLYNEEDVGPEVFVVEGPFDALSLVAWEFPTVGLNGGARPGAITKLQRVQKAYLVLDPDRAGFQTTMALAHALWPRAFVVQLPDGLDPSDFYCQRSKMEFEELVGKATDPIRFAVGQVSADLPREQLGEALEPVFRLLAARPVTAEGFLEGVIAPHFGLSKAWIKRCRQEIDRYAQGVPTKCPACGTILSTRKPA